MWIFEDTSYTLKTATTLESGKKYSTRAQLSYGRGYVSTHVAFATNLLSICGFLHLKCKIEKIMTKLTTISCLVLILQGLGANAEPFRCYAGSNNETLENTIHLSDVVLAGRIVSVSEGEFGTYSAVVSYYYSYKHDGLMQKRFFWYTSVNNFIVPPQVGQLGMFFLFRDPSMRLSLSCMTPLDRLLNDGEGYQEAIDFINEIGSSE